MNEITTTTNAKNLFNFGDHTVRTHLDIKGNPWFVAVDVCAAVGIKNSRDSLTTLDEDDKGVAIADTLGGKQEVTTVNESGLYALIFRSRKSEAKKFKKWVTGTVLPTLRKDGVYIVGEEKLSFDGMHSSQIQAYVNQLQEKLADALNAKLMRCRLEHEEEKDAPREAFRFLRR